MTRIGWWVVTVDLGSVFVAGRLQTPVDEALPEVRGRARSRRPDLVLHARRQAQHAQQSTPAF